MAGFPTRKGKFRQVYVQAATRARDKNDSVFGLICVVWPLLASSRSGLSFDVGKLALNAKRT